MLRKISLLRIIQLEYTGSANQYLLYHFTKEEAEAQKDNLDFKLQKI